MRAWSAFAFAKQDSSKAQMVGSSVGNKERRQNQGMANNLVGELRLTDPGSFQNFLR